MEEVKLKKTTASESKPAVDIVQMLKENRELLEAIYISTEKTKKYIWWGRVMTFVYLILILAPLVVGAIYLKPIFQQYMEMLGPMQGVIEQGGQVQNQLDGYLEMLKNFK